MKFQYHSIALPYGSRTIPGEPLFNQSPECALTLCVLKDRFPLSIRPTITVVDLGALEGGYAVELARAGFRVTIIEAREENAQKCRYIAHALKLNIQVIQDDAKNLANYGPFHVVLCLGLLYHMDRPVDFLKLIGQQTTSYCVVNTHYAHIKDRRYDQPPWISRTGRFIYKYLPFAFRKMHHNLSQLEYNERYLGRWYREYPADASRRRVEKAAMSSFSNHRSFWLTRGGIEGALRHAGFLHVSRVFERPGADRAIFLASK